MNIPLLSYLVHLIESILKNDAPVIGKAAATAAVATAESDPKVQAITVASVALLAATQNLKTAVEAHPDAPEIIPATK
jgi:hypothetical protein